TVLFDRGRAIGHNTDWSGFGRNFDMGLPGAAMDRVVQLGAGGAGAAVAYALLHRGAHNFVVVDADRGRAQRLCDSLANIFVDRDIAAAGIDDATSVLRDADGMVNATPMGMAAHPGMTVSVDVLRPDLWVAEVVYRPIDTALLQAARAAGARTLSGAGMAVYQAVDAFRIFTGVEPDAARMHRHMLSLVHREQKAA
ncbi:MAG: shikimate dehydrogenase, partial [Aldersonia sp.]|nr:shikimate dehydrogenase [Aldersonia sp.]